MINIEKMKAEYPALSKFLGLKFDKHFSTIENGYKIDYDFKQELYNDIEKMFNKYDDFYFKLKKYELEKIPMLVASNKVFKERCKEVNEKNEKLSNEKAKDRRMIEEMAKYINRCDHETIWCRKSKCNQECYECILEDFLEKLQ